MLMNIDSRRLGRFQLRLLSAADTAALKQLRAGVLAQLAHPDLYVREPDEGAFIRAHMGPHGEGTGETIGVFDGEDLVAYAMLGLPDADAPGNLGRHLPLPAQAMGGVAHIASCMVREDCRGHGLQRLLLAARFSLAQARGRVICIAMVSLHNQASRRNLMREGMRIGWVGDLDGLHRQLLVAHLTQPWEFDSDQVQLVERLDWVRQGQLAREGWWGVSELEGRGQNALVFARRLAGTHPATP